MDLTQVQAGQSIFKVFASEVKAAGARLVRFIITTSGPDRERDAVRTDGIDVTSFMMNAVVTWCHDYKIPPIGRCVSIERFPDKLVATVEFATADLSPLADQIFRMVSAGFIQAASIGFRPLEWVYNEARRGVDFIKTELLEFAICVVPVNAEALVAMRAAGVDTSVLRSWARQTLDATGDDEIVLMLADEPDANDRITISRRDLVAEISRQVEPLADALRRHREAEPTFNISPTEARAIIGTAVREHFGGFIAREVRSTINRLRGRIDDDIIGGAPGSFRR